MQRLFIKLTFANICPTCIKKGGIAVMEYNEVPRFALILNVYVQEKVVLMLGELMFLFFRPFTFLCCSENSKYCI